VDGATSRAISAGIDLQIPQSLEKGAFTSLQHRLTILYPERIILFQ
jgi:hypothetical protein